MNKRLFTKFAIWAFVIMAILIGLFYMLWWAVTWIYSKFFELVPIAIANPFKQYLDNYLGWAILTVMCAGAILFGFSLILRQYRRYWPNKSLRSTYWRMKFSDWRASGRGWWKSDIALASLGWTAMWFLVYLNWPEWWMARWKENLFYLVTPIIAILIGIGIRKPGTPIRYKVGPIVVIVANVVLVFFLVFDHTYGQQKMEEWRQALKSWVWADETADLSDGFVESENLEHWSNHVTNENGNVVDALKTMISESQLPKRHWDLAMQIAWQESRFEQHDASGNPLVSPTNDIGIFQINIPTWLKKSKELGEDYDLGTLDGNIRMAMWIWTNPERRGPREWTGTYNKAMAVVRNARTTPEAVNVRQEETPQLSEPSVQDVQTAGIVPILSATPALKDISSYPDEEQELQIEMPRGGDPSRWIKCARPSCVLVATEKIKYQIEGETDYNVGIPFVEYSLGQGRVRVLDGRYLFSYEKAVPGHVTITQ